MNLWLQLILLPTVGALIGWITNWIAIRMLFRPRKPVSLLGIKLQGLVPRRQADLARKIGEVVEREIISHEDIRKYVTAPEFHEMIRRRAHKHVELFVKERLYSVPLLGNVLPMEAIADKIRDLVLDEIEGVLPSLMDGFMHSLEERIEFRKLVTEKVEKFELERLEGIVVSIARKELRYIELLGGVLGFVIGLIQFAVVALAR
jgi:uncharacterized membrane protein YheB (UPF0754 family)